MYTYIMSTALFGFGVGCPVFICISHLRRIIVDMKAYIFHNHSLKNNTALGNNELSAHKAPIPLDAGDVANWKSISIREKSEPLVPIGAYTTVTTLLTSSVYFGEHNSSPYTGEHRLAGSLLSIFVREGVARRLQKAQQLLPKGHRLLVLDAYRPLQVQDSLFHFYYHQLQRQRPDMNKDALSAETQKYVSVPSSDPTRPSPHNTGGSVDLAIVKLPLAQSATLDQIDNRLANEHLCKEDRVALETQKSAIVRRHARMLNFGTAFDHGGEQAGIAYFEERQAQGIPLSAEELAARDNRRLLYNVMAQAGMQAYAAEWWHFNAPESQMGASTAGRAMATYGGAVLDAHHNAHETLRRELYNQALQAGDDPSIVAKPWPVEIIGPQNA